MAPLSGCSSPAIERRRVVLPQPLGPSRATIERGGTCRSTPRSTGWRPNCFRRSVTSMVPALPFSTFHSVLPDLLPPPRRDRSEEHTSELQSLMRISYAVFCLNKKKEHTHKHEHSDTDDYL